MKVKEIADLLRNPYVWINEDLYHTVDIPEDVGNKEVDFMCVISRKAEYLTVITKK